MEPFVPIPRLDSLIHSALHNDMQIWQNMKVVLSGKIWSNALFSESWKCLSSWRILFICLLRNPHSAISSSFSVCLHLKLSSFTQFANFSSICLLLQLFSHLSSSHPQGCMEVNTPEKLYSPQLLSQSHLQTARAVLYYHALLRANCVSKSPKDSRGKDLEGWNPS